MYKYFAISSHCYTIFKKAEPQKREESVPRCDNAAHFINFIRFRLLVTIWRNHSIAFLKQKVAE